MMLTCSRAFSAVIIAQGSEPSAPPCAAAMTRSASIAPAIGASTIGNSVLKRSRRRRSGHMVVSLWSAASGDEIAAAEQQLLGLGDDAFHDLGDWRNIMDQPNRLACDDGGDIKISGGLSGGVFGSLLFHPLQQLDLAAHPALG